MAAAPLKHFDPSQQPGNCEYVFVYTPFSDHANGNCILCGRNCAVMHEYYELGGDFDTETNKKLGMTVTYNDGGSAFVLLCAKCHLQHIELFTWVSGCRVILQWLGHQFCVYFITKRLTAPECV